MKLIARAATALALLAFATPALPCGDKGMEKTKTVKSDQEKSSTVAKSGTAEKKTPPAKGEVKPASAAN